MRTLALVIVAAFSLVLSAKAETKTLINVDEQGVALQGYDPVGYFTENKPVKGDPKISASYKGATYYFASVEHKKTFDRSPSRYEPQFGGFCGYAASINKVAPIEVQFFQIVDGRLILQHNERAWNLWIKDVRGNLHRADENWPALVENNGR